MPHAYIVQVKANGITGSGLNDSAYSEELVIIDTPITKTDGTSPRQIANGTATLTWVPIEDVLNDADFEGGEYYFVHRQLDGNHSAADWDPDHYLNNPVSTWDDRVSNVTTDDISGLEGRRIHAIQLRYKVETETTPGTTEVSYVYAARDVYVYPAFGQPNTNRVASYPYFGHWSNKEIHYRVCENTFHPVNNQTKWSALVTHVFKQWEVASEELLTMRPAVGSCGLDGSPMSMLTSIHNGTNEVFMVDSDNFDTFLSEGAETALNPLFRCILGDTPTACVISPDYRRPHGPTLNLGRSFGPFNLGIRRSVDVLVSRKITLNRGVPRPINIPGGDNVYSEDDVKFNTCQPRPAGDNPDEGFYLYQLLLHEAGHVLGMSGFAIQRAFTEEGRYKMAHPTIPDSVLNYDNRVQENLDSGDVQTRHEPDCSPTPFDRMVLRALYQTVN